MNLGSIALAVFGIGLLIFIHEGGHFLAARLAGVRVEVFSLGFGPRLGGFVWRGTDFRVSAVPFGGYVMVAGQDPKDRRYPARECLWSKSVGQRALFWSGGVLMNALFALVIFPVVFSAGVRFEAPVVGEVTPGSPAWEAGVEKGERVLEVSGKPVYSFQNMAIEVALSGRRPVELLLEDSGGERRRLTAQPRFQSDRGLYGLGLRPAYDERDVVLTVDADGPAAAAGLRTGDRLLAIDGDAAAAVEPIESMQPVEVEVERDGVRLTATVTPDAGADQGRPLLGVRPLPHRVAGLRRAAVAPAALGLARDDVILAIDGRRFLTGELEGYADAGDGAARVTTWLVERDGERLELSAELTAADRRQLAEAVALDTDPRLQLLPTEGSAAAEGGVQAGDWLVGIDGADIADWDQLRAAVQQQGTTPLFLDILRPDPTQVDAPADEPSGTRLALTIQPRRAPSPELGFRRSIAPLMTEIRAESLGEAVRLGTVCSLDLVKQLYVTLKRLITGEVGAKNLGGIIRISQVSYQAAQRGPSWFWYFLALLSVNLAFVNLLPVPVLDGGHLLFLLIEKVKGSPVSTKVFGYSQVIGLVFVLLLILFVTYNDILRLL